MSTEVITDPTAAATGADQTSADAPVRPEYIPEKFWKDDAPDIEGLAKSYTQLETSYRNRTPIDLPGDATGYQLKPDTLPEGVTWSDEAAAKFAGVFHANGVSPAQARAITDAFLEIEAGNHASISAAYQKTISDGTAALKEEWGDAYDAKLSAVKETVQRLGYDPEDSSLFTNAKVVSFLGKVVGSLGEDAIAASGGTAAPGAVTPGGGEAEAERIMRDPTHPQHSAYASGDPEVVKKVLSLLGAG